MKISLLLLIVLVGAIATVGYIYYRIARHHRNLQIAIIAMSGFMIISTTWLTFSMKHLSNWQQYNYVQWLLFAYAVAIALTGPVGLAAIIARRKMPAFWNRHRLGITATAMMGGMIPTMWLLYGMAYERYNYEVRPVEIPFADLPAHFDGYKIAVISDAHLGSFWGDTARLAPAMDSVNAYKPDMIVFAGDLVNNFANETDGWRGTFRKLKADKKFAILGNHDVSKYSNWSSDEEMENNSRTILNRLKEFGFDVIRDTLQTVDKDGDTLVIVGTDYDYQGDLFNRHLDYCHRHFSLWLNHIPETWDSTMVAMGIDFRLTISGHTHGGQVGIRLTDKYVFSLAGLLFDYCRGLHEKNGKYIYVNSGLGTNGLPVRLGVRPEVTIITLRRQDSK